MDTVDLLQWQRNNHLRNVDYFASDPRLPTSNSTRESTHLLHARLYACYLEGGRSDFPRIRSVVNAIIFSSARTREHAHTFLNVYLSVCLFVHTYIHP